MNVKKSIVVMSAAVFCLLACQSSETKTEKAPADTASAAMKTEAKQYDIALVDNRKDPTCGMPVTAGIGDTAHYKDKVLGFCSAECKEEFKKNPEAGLVAAELKNK